LKKESSTRGEEAGFFATKDVAGEPKKGKGATRIEQREEEGGTQTERGEIKSKIFKSSRENSGEEGERGKKTLPKKIFNSASETKMARYFCGRYTAL